MTKEEMRERLAQLPLRAVVAFAARCARRVQPLTHAPPQRPADGQEGRDAIDRAIASAEAFANGDAGFSDAACDARATAGAVWGAARDAAGDAADAARDAADAARTAARAATDAARAAWAAAAWPAEAAGDAAEYAASAFVWAANTAVGAANTAGSDLDRLIALELGQPGTLGAPIDPSEAGPLGPLCPPGSREV